MRSFDRLMAVVPLLIITVIITGMAPQKTENNKFLPVGEVVAGLRRR